MNKPVLPNSVEARDIAFHIHSPQTNPQLIEERGPLVVTRGEGVRIYDNAGKAYIDAMAGLWCASLGFSNERLRGGGGRQYAELGFYHTFFQRTMDGVATLAEKLVELTGMTGGKAYFATSGSEANETMVKLAWVYHSGPRQADQAQGDRARSRLPRLDHRRRLDVRPALHAPRVRPAAAGLPAHARPLSLSRHAGGRERGGLRRAPRRRAARSSILREGPDSIAAFIAEPIHAGGGIIVPPAGYFARIQEVLKKYDILFLDDEIVCGFERTGNWFGKETVGAAPDMMSLAKGLSSSYFPISAVVVAPAIYEALREFNKAGGNFGHGFTNSGHPVGVAVALEAIKIYEEMDIVEHVRTMGAAPARPFRAHRRRIPRSSAQVRGAGLMLGIELVADKATKAAVRPASAGRHAVRPARL